MRYFLLVLALLSYFCSFDAAAFGGRHYRSSSFSHHSYVHNYNHYSIRSKFKKPKKPQDKSVIIGRYQAKNVNGRRVYQRNDIDWNKTDKRGRTNYQRAKSGRAPIGNDGEPVNLHHVIQHEKGTLAEVNASTHQKHYKALHGSTAPKSSFRQDDAKKKQYDNYRSNYWKKRSESVK